VADAMNYATKTMPSVRFFFSSRRRHTRFSRDWSSDVCSSDLDEEAESGSDEDEEKEEDDEDSSSEGRQKHSLTCQTCSKTFEHKIGRASCRERGKMRVGEGTVMSRGGGLSVRRHMRRRANTQR